MLGNTRFTMEDEPGPLSLKIVRHNSDGAKEFHIPKLLVVAYAKAVLADRVASLIDGMLR